MPVRLRQHESGLTLVEVAICVGIVTILAGVALQARAGLARAEEERAVADALQIIEALQGHFEDTRLAPTGAAGAPGLQILIGERGAEPALPIAVAGDAKAGIEATLGRNAFADPRWRGPYLNDVPPDPWGQAYCVWVSDFHTTAPVWVLSAGPNATLDTPPQATAPIGDDLGAALP